ncbi:MAG: mannose-1-phosphate guanylyltransferase [Deltaproteobacteria bacterium]|nr:mannose-1-phosphate guanylyltransferase [Deltaproteobacteria bacterium]
MNLYAVIMAGGSGTRFWPKSRQALPKQLIPITSQKSMIEETVDRLKAFLPAERIFVITNPDQGRRILEIIPGFKEEQIIYEPFGRDTAACVGLAAARLAARDPEGVMCLLPADHVIRPVEFFAGSIKTGASVAREQGGFVTIGIKPTFPATSYGYIHRSEKISEGIYRVAEFCEKPDLSKAEVFVASGDYFWNGGIFVWKIETIMTAIREHMPRLASGLDRIMAQPDSDDVLQDEYQQFEKISIDYGIMEKVDNVFTVEAEFDWDDVGSWSAVRSYYARQEDNAVCNRNLTAVDSRNNIVNVSEKKRVVLIDVDDLVVVDTDDALLICPAGSDQKVKAALDKLKEQGLDKLL